MWGTLEIPVWLAALGALAAGVALLDRVLGPSIRWWMRRRLLRAVERLNSRLSLRIQPFKLMERKALITRLSHDPDVMAAAEATARESGMPPDLVYAQVVRYAEEIVPSFSAFMYFGIGARVSKWVARWLYHVRLGAFDRGALAAVDPDATIVFVMNHRSNVDYLLVTYLASAQSALSYAVGEWARIWPLSWVIRSMGAYFVRRKSRDSLYRAVLRRYVQMATAGGVTQAVFPEGGLSRDGRLGPPKLGLLSYIVDGFDPAESRDVLFVPVGLNYDRVLEDRLLLRAGKPADLTKMPETPGKQTPAKRFDVSVWTALGFVFGHMIGRMTGRAHKFGHACVSFGAPLSLKQHLGVHQSDPVGALGQEILERIGAIIPALPVSLTAAALLGAGRPLSRADLLAAVTALAEERRAAGGSLHVPNADLEYGVEVGLRMLILRRIVGETPAGIAPLAGEEALLAYYAHALTPLRGAESRLSGQNNSLE